MFHGKPIFVASIMLLLVPVGVQETLAGGGLKVIVHGNGQACVSSSSEDLGCRQISSQGTFEFDGSPDRFTACLDGDCKSGQNSPAKAPEHVYFGSGGGGFQENRPFSSDGGGGNNNGNIIREGSGAEDGKNEARTDFLNTNGRGKDPSCSPYQHTDSYCTAFKFAYEAQWAYMWLQYDCSSGVCR